MTDAFTSPNRLPDPASTAGKTVVRVAGGNGDGFL